MVKLSMLQCAVTFDLIVLVPAMMMYCDQLLAGRLVQTATESDTV